MPLNSDKSVSICLRNLTSKFTGSSYWRDIAWLSTGSLIAQGLTVASMPIISRLYTPAEFGNANIFITISSFIVGVSSFRFETLIPLPRSSRTGLALVQIVGILCILSAVLLCMLGWFFRETLGSLSNNNNIEMLIPFIPIAAATSAFAMAAQSWTQRNERYRSAAFSAIVSKFTLVTTQICGSVFIPNGLGLIAAQILSPLGQIIYLAKEKNLTFTRPTINKNELMAAIKAYKWHSASSLLAYILMCINGAIPTFFIQRTYGPETLGQFFLSTQLLYFPSALLGTAIGNVFFQRASALFSQGESFKALWYTTIKRLLLIGIPSYAFLGAVAQFFIPLYLGPQWSLAGKLAGPMCIAAFFSFVTTPVDRCCLIVSATWYIPMWQILRTGTAMIVAVAAARLRLSIEQYITLFVTQMTIMYLVDLYFEWRFSTYTPIGEKYI